MVRTAVIMAAGLGTRFGEKTKSIPKGFIEVGGTSMIERSVKTIINCGIQRIIIGTGYMKEMYESLSLDYPEILCVYSEHYSTTNSMWTLWNCSEAIGSEDFLLFESDLVFEKRAISELIDSNQENIMLCSDVTKFQDSYFIEYDSNNYLINCSVNKDLLNVSGELVGIHKISSSLFKKLNTFYSSIKDTEPKMGYEFALLHMAKKMNDIYVLKIPHLKWYEIDDEEDLKFAEKYIVNCLNLSNK
jgi:choline kinase